MGNSQTAKYQLFDDPLRFYDAMLADIRKAKKYIYLQTYKYGNDSMGHRFREALIRKAREGVKVKVLIDSWGSGVPHSYFHELIRNGGEVRFFTKIKFFIDFFTKNHRRNHRKYLIIDDNITYIGSANITAYSIGWRELKLRAEGALATAFKKVFNLDFRIYNKYFFEKNSYIRLIRYADFEIVRDVPSITKKRISKKFISLIKNAKRSVYIETPYFLPGYLLRKAMMEATERGVNIIVIVPRHSDVGLVDILRNKYIGPLHLSKVKFLYFQPTNLHAKAMLVDDEIFAIGSPNFDYRSFRYMHEIALVGRDPEICRQLKNHITDTMNDCQPFDYEKWERRPRFQRFAEWILLPFRHLL
jgi:cardiolipin synthase